MINKRSVEGWPQSKQGSLVSSPEKVSNKHQKEDLAVLQRIKLPLQYAKTKMDKQTPINTPHLINQKKSA